MYPSGKQRKKYATGNSSNSLLVVYSSWAPDGVGVIVRRKILLDKNGKHIGRHIAHSATTFSIIDVAYIEPIRKRRIHNFGSDFIYVASALGEENVNYAVVKVILSGLYVYMYI